MLWRNGHFANSKMGRGISGYYDSIKAGRVLYRSTFELRAYQLLDNDPLVKNYKVEPLSIFYGRKNWYKPDLLVEYQDGHKLLIEVKASWNANSEETNIKSEAAMKYIENSDISEFVIWTEKDLWQNYYRRE